MDFEQALDTLVDTALSTLSGAQMVIRVAAREGFATPMPNDFLGAAFFLVQRGITFTDVCERCS